MVKIDPETCSDENLVKFTLKDEDLFLHIMERYEKKLLSYIHRLTNVTEEDGEDILQEIFIKTYQNLNGFDKNLKFSSWIFRIAHNEVISHFRKVSSRPRKIETDENFDINEKLISDLGPEKEMEKKYLEQNIKKALLKINIKYREIIILRFFEEKSYKEISDILRKPEGTVATLLNRAKKKLEKEIKYTKII